MTTLLIVGAIVGGRPASLTLKWDGAWIFHVAPTGSIFPDRALVQAGNESEMLLWLVQRGWFIMERIDG